MEVHITFQLTAAALAGVLLSILYFGGLWLTIGKLQQSSRPGALLFASFVVRMGLVVAGFFLVSGGDLGRLAACFAAFLVTRWVFIKRIQLGPKNQSDFAGQVE